jgi:polyisoprenyl-phosphate glycosyltransferase
MMPRPTLSLVFPIYNEEAVLPELHRELQGFLGRLGLSTEVLFVDDGSSDRTGDSLREMVKLDPRYRHIALARNFGQPMAISAGLDYARGHAVVVMSADLQDPFEVIQEMVNLWKQGYDVVHGRMRSPDGSSAFARFASSFSSKLVGTLYPSEVPLDTGEFRLMTRRVVVALRELRESHRFVRGMVSWVGFKQIDVVYNRAPRTLGQTKYPPLKRLGSALSSVASFSALPLRLMMYLGLLTAALSVLTALWAIGVRIFSDTPVPGWATVVVLVGIVSGVQLSMVGMLGEYIGRIYEQLKQRPLYVVAETTNLGDRDDAQLEPGLPPELGNFNSLAPPVMVTAPYAVVQHAQVVQPPPQPVQNAVTLPQVPSTVAAPPTGPTVESPAYPAGAAMPGFPGYIAPTNEPKALARPATLVGVPVMSVDAARTEMAAVTVPAPTVPEAAAITVRGSAPPPPPVRPSIESADIIEVDAKKDPPPRTAITRRDVPRARTTASPGNGEKSDSPKSERPPMPSSTRKPDDKNKTVLGVAPPSNPPPPMPDGSPSGEVEGKT